MTATKSVEKTTATATVEGPPPKAGQTGRGSSQNVSQPSDADANAQAERENARKADAERYSTPANAPVLPRVNQRDDIELYGVNKEGYVAAAPEPFAEEGEVLTIVEARMVLGYGGPINVTGERGDQKAFGGDAIYTLSDGNRYVFARQLAEALGNTLPEPNAEEVRLLEEQAYGWQVAKERAAERGDATEDEMTGTIGSSQQRDEIGGRGKPYTGQGSAIPRHTGSQITGQGEPGPGKPSKQGDGFDDFK